MVSNFSKSRKIFEDGIYKAFSANKVFQGKYAAISHPFHFCWHLYKNVHDVGIKLFLPFANVFNLQCCLILCRPSPKLVWLVGRRQCTIENILGTVSQ